MVYSFCNNCKTVFASRAIKIHNSPKGERLSIGNISEPCIRCKSMADVLSGEYEFDDNGILNIISGPDFSIKTLKKIKTVLEKAAKEKKSTEQVVEEVAVFHPSFAKFMEDGFPKGAVDIITLLGLIVAIIALKHSGNPQIVNNNYYIKEDTKKAAAFSKKRRKNRKR